jgi:hypothetical protein
VDKRFDSKTIMIFNKHKVANELSLLISSKPILLIIRSDSLARTYQHIHAEEKKIRKFKLEA